MEGGPPTRSPTSHLAVSLYKFSVISPFFGGRRSYGLDDDVVVTSPAERFMDHPYIHLYIDKYIP